MARRCEICDKGNLTGMSISHSHIRNKKMGPNLQKVRAIVNGTPKRLTVCIRCLRSGELQELSKTETGLLEPVFLFLAYKQFG